MVLLFMAILILEKCWIRKANTMKPSLRIEEIVNKTQYWGDVQRIEVYIESIIDFLDEQHERKAKE